MHGALRISISIVPGGAALPSPTLCQVSPSPSPSTHAGSSLLPSWRSSQPPWRRCCCCPNATLQRSAGGGWVARGAAATTAITACLQLRPHQHTELASSSSHHRRTPPCIPSSPPAALPRASLPPHARPGNRFQHPPDRLAGLASLCALRRVDGGGAGAVRVLQRARHRAARAGAPEVRGGGGGGGGRVHVRMYMSRLWVACGQGRWRQGSTRPLDAPASSCPQPLLLICASRPLLPLPLPRFPSPPQRAAGAAYQRRRHRRRAAALQPGPRGFRGQRGAGARWPLVQRGGPGAGLLARHRPGEADDGARQLFCVRPRRGLALASC